MSSKLVPKGKELLEIKKQTEEIYYISSMLKSP